MKNTPNTCITNQKLGLMFGHAEKGRSNQTPILIAIDPEPGDEVYLTLGPTKGQYSNPILKADLRS